MKNVKKKTLFGIVIGILLILCLQASAITSHTDDSIISEYKIPKYIFRKIDTFQPQKLTESQTPLSSGYVGLLGTDVLIYGSADEGIICQNPTVTDDSANKYLLVLNNGLISSRHPIHILDFQTMVE